MGSHGAIGYCEFLYSLQNNIPFGLLKNREGLFIKASPAGMTAAAEAAYAENPHAPPGSITDARGPDSYPVSGYVWAILYRDQPAEKGKRQREFLRWATHDGQSYCDDLYYSPLPKNVRERAEEELDRIKAGD